MTNIAGLRQSCLLTPLRATSLKAPVASVSFASATTKRGKGKRGGIRVIYYYWVTGWQVWLFTLYGKDEMDDLSNDDRRELASALSAEVTLRNNE